jgi:hypothetical protein
MRCTKAASYHAPVWISLLCSNSTLLRRRDIEHSRRELVRRA